MNILALDTTSEFGSVAIHRDGTLRAAQHVQSSEGFADRIIRMIDETIEQSGLALRDVDCFAAASGPGSFTGVRVGLAAIKGLAEAEHKPAAAISNLRAAAAAGSSAERAVILDARRGQVFAAVYNDNLDLVRPEVVTDLDPWLEALEGFEGDVIAPASYRERIEPRHFVLVRRHLASAIAFCAELDGRKGQWADPAALDANYIRRPDAELLWKP